MIGRIVGFVAGAAIAAAGYGMLKPAIFARYVDLSKLNLGPFAEYRATVCWVIVAFGAVVAVAALQRPSAGASRKSKSSPAVFAPAEADHEPPLMADPEAEVPDGHAPFRREPSPSGRTPTPLW